MGLTVIVEPNPGGHRFQAVGFVAEQARSSGQVLLLTSRGASSCAQFAEFLAGTDLAVEEPFEGVMPATPVLARTIASTCRDHGDVATVIVMEGDDALRQWWFVAAKELRSLPRRPRVIFFLTRYPARLEGANFAGWKIRIAKGVLVAAAMLTRTLHRSAGFAGRDEFATGWLVKRARDPVECSAHRRDRAALRTELGLPHDRTLIGISGGINVRKDPGLVLAALLESGLEADLVLSGPFSDEIRQWLAGLPAAERDRVIVEDAFLSNERLDQYIAAVDVVVLAMRLEGPSGIMGKALAAGVPLVTAGSRTRERELRATSGGEAAELTPASIGAALKRVLAGPASPDLSVFPLPTGATFAATILGTEPPRRRRASRLRAFVSTLRPRVRHHGAIRILRLWLRPRPRPGLVRLGSDYGGWWIPEASAVPGAVAYCAGAGEDITFDLALYERGCAVTTFDPTPRAIAHVEREAPSDARFRFEPVGWWDAESEVKFYSPLYEGHVSHSIVNLRGTTDYFVAKVKPVHQLMSELGDDHVDIIKMDIEGAEYTVLDSLLRDGPLPPVLCVEFDQPAPLHGTVAAVRRLQRAGYVLNKIDAWNYTFTR